MSSSVIAWLASRAYSGSAGLTSTYASPTIWPSWSMADSGARRCPFGSLMTNIANHLDPVAHIEVQHDIKCGPCVATEHVDERGSLAGGDGRERIREELTAAQCPVLPVEVARQARLAPLVERTELVRVRLPLAAGPIEVIEGVPDLVAHHVRRGGGPRADDDLALAVGTRTGIPCRVPRGQRDPAQAAHVVEVGYAARTHVYGVHAVREALGDRQGQLGQAVDGPHHLRRRECLLRPVTMEHPLQRAAVPVAHRHPARVHGLEPRRLGVHLHRRVLARLRRPGLFGTGCGGRTGRVADGRPGSPHPAAAAPPGRLTAGRPGGPGRPGRADA